MNDTTAQLQRTTAMFGAWLMVASLLTGGLVAGSMTGTIPAEPRIMLAAHVTGVLGVFFTFAVAWSLPLLNYSDAGRKRIAWLVIVANWAGLIITAAKAFPAVHGVGYEAGQPANNLVFVLLNIFVVVPALVAAVAWAWGLRGAAAGTRSP